MTTQRTKLTKRSVDAAQVPETGEVWIWDTEVKGFFLRIRPSGRKVYAVRYRLGSIQNTYTIGVHGSPWTPDTARDEALSALSSVRDGLDPAADKKEARKALTVGALIDAYLADGPATKPGKRQSTWDNDASNLNRHVRPLMGRKIANTVTKAEAARAVQDITAGKTAADIKTGPRGRARISGGAGVARRTRTTAAAMFAWGIEHGLTKANPFAGVRLSAAPVRERFLTKGEAATFLDKLTELESTGQIGGGFADAARLLLLTGARKTEVLGLRWSEVDIGRRVLVLPPERTKAGGHNGERRVILSPAALEILDRRRTAQDLANKKALKDSQAKGESPAPPSPYVFPASRGDGHAIGLRKAFSKVLAAAELGDVRVHDLRHSFASFLVADKVSLFMVGKMLGHASARTAERYAHLADDPLQAAAASVGSHLVPTKNDETAEIIPLPRRS
ncbi:MAG: site-specific integrase [bacterium]|nr:site-specific integrase [bacterium]